jgi:hypothetical protein
MKPGFYIAVLSILFCSCERETEVKMPPRVPKLVAEAGQWQNQMPVVRISRTRGVTDPDSLNRSTDPWVVKNVKALLFENGILRDSLRYDVNSEKYKATIARIQPGNTYKLTLSATGYPDAEASSYTPSLVTINSLIYNRNVRPDRQGYMLDEIRLSFADDPGTEDYYLVRIMNSSHNFNYCITTNDKDVEKLVYDDPLYPDDCISSDRVLLSDVNFNGTIKTLVLNVGAGQLEPAPGPGGRLIRSTVELLHINKDYFKYIKSLNSYDNAVDNPFAEPVNLYTNVKNGYGFFTTFGRVVDSIR